MTQQRRTRTRSRREVREFSGEATTNSRATVAQSEPPARRTQAAGEPAVLSAPPVRRRTSNGAARTREIDFTGLAGRAREPLAPPPLALADAFALALPGLRHALLDRPFEEAVGVVAEGIATTLDPARAEVWIAEPAAWSSASAHVGGQELPPVLRLRARGIAAGADVNRDALHGATHPPSSQPGQLVAEVAATRRSMVLHEGAAQQPPADAYVAEWLDTLAPVADADRADRLGVTREGTSSAPGVGTVLAIPLLARGQFLGVLAASTLRRLGARHLAALDDLADLTALAADRDQLFSFSRSQAALAQTVVRHAPVAIAVLTGTEHTFALANPTFSLLLGRESTQPLAGKRLAEIDPERASELAASLRLDAVLHGGEHQAMIELPLHAPERGLTYWNVTSSPLAGRGPVAAGVLVAAVDVTRQVLARQRAQEVAEVAQERIGQMMALHATSLEVASQLGTDSRELVADILHRSIALLGARAGAVYVRDERRDELRVIVSQGLRGDYAGTRIRIGEGLAGQVAASGAGLVVDDYRVSPLRGPIYEGEDFRAVIAVPLRHHNHVIGVLDVLDDAERRVFTRDDLWLLELFATQAAQAIENAHLYVELDRAYRKQRALDRLKDDFIATASHELRTPLTGVQGFLDLLHDYPGSRDEPRALDFLQRAAESAQELADIAERLLQTSRLDTGRLELHIGPVRVASVVDEVLRSYRERAYTVHPGEQADEQGGAHEPVSEVARECCVFADVARLKEVLDNVIGNALKYSPQGGRVVVTCEQAALAAASPEEATEADDPLSERPTQVLPQLGTERDADDAPDQPRTALQAAVAAGEPFLMIAVSDEGMGIPEDERERLFGRFSRGDSARESQIRGTGLGLYICRQNMRAMGGDIWLHASAPGTGSTFALALPAASVAEVADTVALSPDVHDEGTL
ncbi:MAG TPA: GAF domain-containing sensor histidine kinase [Ktedonobacterales bacterium]